MTLNATSRGKLIGSLMGFVTLFIGFAVLAGWLAGSENVVTLWGIGPPMSEKTALCFILAGGGLVALRWEHPLIVMLVGALMLVAVGAADGRVSILNGVGQWFSSIFDRVPDELNVNGRMAPYTALSFVLLAVALLTHAQKDFRRKAAVLGLFGPLMMALPTASLLCFAFGIFPREKGGLAGMAIHTAGGLLCMGVGVTGIEYSAARKRLRKWWPVVLAAFFVVVTLVVWQALLAVTPASTIIPTLILAGGLAVSAGTALLGYLVQTARRALQKSEAAETALREANETLERRVAERTEELTRKNAELDRFSAVAAHDLKSPVASMVSFAELIGEELGTTASEEVTDFLVRIRKNGHRALALIDGLLEIARTGSKTPSGETDAQSMFEQAISNLQSSIHAAGALVTSSALPRICGDEMQVLQLLQNLLANALKFRKPGTVPKIHIGVDEQDSRWLFCVHDNGIGIDPKDSGKVFELFGRAAGAKTYDGTGLGLAVCRKIVETHGGQIWFDSKLGQGTTFYFTLPKLENSVCAKNAANRGEKGPVSLPSATM